jgi:hypothetical protein
MQRFWEFIIFYLYEIPKKDKHEKEIYFRKITLAMSLQSVCNHAMTR